jgi:hypothetical protein
LLFSVAPLPIDVVVGCSYDQECPEYNSCINQVCRNPCALLDPCAANALCKVIHHTAKCACPAGYIGDPQIECKPPRKRSKNQQQIFRDLKIMTKKSSIY